ncbi:hypothetical protein DFR70_103675 [Nocardia tenerifensis]|uniref:SprT-like family protein n=1 Tax=Nocardia tenerifensis TaxID=228006 RepID=A0A318K637_9NOCA|nr:hypothetical protein [Nocardia tenerifensis]PXX66920.1 hypothetical protein DFR70_103675 [Nocardia tenerifensis]
MAVGGPLATAIDTVWESIRARHPDVPDVVVAVASGSLGRGRAPRLGHFGPDRWERAGAWMPELFVGGEGLAAGARAVLATMLHEAAHGLALTRDIAETSDSGRYHNKKFKELADELGLSTVRHQRAGWSITALPDMTAARYGRELHILTGAIVAHRRPEHGADDTSESGGPDVDDTDAAGTKRGRRATKDRNASPFVCRCATPRRIRAHKKIIEAGPILCGLCREPFTAAPADDD